ncbi:MAG: hypothetical protein IJI07_09920 [Flexilinea sp.]|nr:hypothetical protein [Flexilinea sp.]
MLKKTVFLFVFILILLTVFRAVAEEENVIAYVGDVPITREMAEHRAFSGTAISSASALSDEEKAAAREEAVKKALFALIAEQACVNEAERLGLDLDENIAAETERLYNKMIGAIENYVRISYPNLDREAMDEQVDSLLKLLGESRESYRETARRSALISALEAYWMNDYPEPSAEEIKTNYDELYSAQKELFDADENAFESAMLNGETVVYRPRDLKMIRKAEFLFSEDVSTYLRQLRQLGVSNADQQIRDQYHMLADEVEPVYEALLSGEKSFTELLEELDPGSSGKVNYFHPESTRFSADYYTRADAFSEIGEISTAYIIANGYAVLEYYGSIPAGELTPEEAAEAIRSAIAEAGSKEYLTARKQDLLDHAEIRFTENEP